MGALSFWGGAVPSWSVLMSQEVPEDFGPQAPQDPHTGHLPDSQHVTWFQRTFLLKLWAWRFSQSCTVLGAASAGTALDFDCCNQGLGHHKDERSKNLVRSWYFSEHIKPQHCAMPFISVSWFHFFSVISSSIAVSCNQDFYATRKGSQRTLFPLSMKVKEANSRASVGRKPYLCLFSLEGSQSKMMRISQGHDIPLLPLHKISGFSHRYISCNPMTWIHFMEAFPTASFLANSGTRHTPDGECDF